MLFLTGDCHGDFRRFSTKAFPAQKTMTKEDLVVILGDAGFLWDGSKQDTWWLDWLDTKPFTTLNIGGNHENYDLLEQYPKIHWNKGIAYQLRPSVLHLCRGQIYDLDGHKTFVMGGAESHDMDVILPPGPDQVRERRRLKKQGIPYRVRGESWWPQELPSPPEHGLAWYHLHQAGLAVDSDSDPLRPQPHPAAAGSSLSHQRTDHIPTVGEGYGFLQALVLRALSPVLEVGKRPLPGPVRRDHSS